MLLPKGGVTWKSARSRLPPWRGSAGPPHTDAVPGLVGRDRSGHSSVARRQQVCVGDAKVNLNPIKSSIQAVSNRERVLILTPLRDAAPYLEKYFDLLYKLSYPHELIDLCPWSATAKMRPYRLHFPRNWSASSSMPMRKSVSAVRLLSSKDFGADVEMSVEERHSSRRSRSSPQGYW
ncbi:hypothetical protein N7532_007602, partial [Penicillium argentinense]